MADLSFDCAAENLLRTETNSLGFDGFESVATDDQTHQTDDLSNNGRSEPLIGFFPFQSEDSLCLMLEREREHLPKDDYLPRLRSGSLDLSMRREALDWICKAHSHYSFGAPSFCLAINYLDRFLSVYELPRCKTWTVQLLAVTCLSLAAKLEEITVPLTVDFQVGDPKFVFEGKTIKRMELLVLSTLKWRMQACTPCSFVDYFLRKINNGDKFPSGSLISRSIQLILSTAKGIDFLEFRPSEISAAVTMCVSGEIQALDTDKAMSFFRFVEKVRVLKCLELIQDLKLISEATNVASGSAQSVPQSPVGVLDAACLSYKSDERTVGSCPNSSHASPDTKRRKTRMKRMTPFQEDFKS